MSSRTLSSYAPLVLRLTMVFVYTWFGVSQLTSPDSWARIVPEWATSLSGLDATMIVTMNGTFEIAASILLLLGVFVRYVSLVLFFHLVVVASTFGLTATGVRDFGLSFATLASALFGQDKWALYPKVANDGSAQ